MEGDEDLYNLQNLYQWNLHQLLFIEENFSLKKIPNSSYFYYDYELKKNYLHLGGNMMIV